MTTIEYKWGPKDGEREQSDSRSDISPDPFDPTTFHLYVRHTTRPEMVYMGTYTTRDDVTDDDIAPTQNTP